MTLRGFLVTLLELALLVFAFGTEMREFFVIALCVGVLEIYSFVSILLASITLNAKSIIDKNVAIRLEGATYNFVLRGIALLPVAGYLSVKNAEYEPKHLKRRKHSFLMLPSFLIEHKFSLEIPCSHIGTWGVGIKKLRFEDVFGLFSVPLIRSRKSRFSVKLSVVPQIHILENDSQSVSSGNFGLSKALDSENGELLGDSRLYREGDTMKRINWKLSARTKSLYSRRYEMPQKPQITIAVDTAVLGYAQADIIDITCESAISLANFFVEQGYAVNIITLRNRGKEENVIFTLTTEKDIAQMQYDFSLLDFYKDNEPLFLSAYVKKHISASDKVFVITSNPSDAVISDLADFKKKMKLTRCIVPIPEDEDDVHTTIEAYDSVKVNVVTADQVKERVGGAL